jgi:ubiquinone/menaquinone biosynthesis C-methylase UbiE
MQVDDLSALMTPLLGTSGEARGVLPRGVIEYQSLLFRDWAWPAVGNREGQAALAVLVELLGGRSLGRQLVLGAGGCGLAYELHTQCGATQTVALDIDPYLLLVAEQVVRGKRVQLTEASITSLTPGEQSRRWELSAPRGALSPEDFTLLFADGIEAPFAAASFDSVVTPWFIDQVPRDLPAFLTALARLVAPGGLWLNQGPLLYPERLGIEARYSAEAVKELASQAGFEVLGEKRETTPYLVSPLSGRGRVEHVWSFVARRR